MGGSGRGARLIAAVSVLSLGLGGVILSADDAKPPAGSFLASKATKTYHKPDCKTAKAITAKNKVEVASVEDASTQGFKPCPICKPNKADDAEPEAAKTDGGDMPSPSKAKTKKGAAKPSAKKGEMTDVEGEMPSDGGMPANLKVKGKKGSAAKGSTKKADATEVAADDKALKFSRDIAPILAGNCAGCHNNQQKRGGFDITSFQKLMNGSAKNKVIAPGNPDESLLILKVRGEQTSGGKMPPGQRNLAPETITKLEEWIKAGAILDKGIDPTATLDSIAPSPEARRRAELAKLTPEERDKKVIEAGVDRWKKASSKVTPKTTTGKNFVVFSDLPPARADRLLKTMDVQRKALGDLLGQSAGALSGLEKISLYVFPDTVSYVEFVRSVENREVESGIDGHGRLDVEQPYVAAIDPLNGRDESPAQIAAASNPSSKKGGKTSKKTSSDEAADGPDRTLPGLLSEHMAASALNAAGKPPRWLSAGLGAWFASRVEPKGGPYFRKLREEAVQQQQNWSTRSNEVLGDEGSPDLIRGMGFSLCEWLSSSAAASYPGFIQGMTQGKEKLDEVVRSCFGDETTREQFLEQWGGFVAMNYRRR